jgi:hypothetical protein
VLLTLGSRQVLHAQTCQSGWQMPF